jgi:23S rRNA (cytosine1962-C5)-methyltransferase
MPSIVLFPGREKSVKQQHPWIFDRAIKSIQGSPELGESVDILSQDKTWLGIGAYSPQSKIRVRVWSWDPTEIVDADYFRVRLKRCLEFRQYIFQRSIPSAYRLVYAEADGLPGLIVDQYLDTLVVQCLSAGIERWRNLIFDILEDITGIQKIYERSDVDVRALEGLPSRKGLVRGNIRDLPFVITEHKIKYLVDIQEGQKTGFYLDQRENRLKIMKYVSDREILDCFSYSGGFTIPALLGKAKQVTAIDESESAHELARINVRLNRFSEDRVKWIKGDVFKILREFRDSRKSFDLIILDPPKFAPTISQVGKATRGYKDINLLALKLLRSEGILVTFSCSGGVDAVLFQKIVTGAARDAGISAQIIERLGQSSDHPIALNFPESEYLKGLVIRKIK